MQVAEQVSSMMELLKSLGEWSYTEPSSLLTVAKQWLNTGIDIRTIEAYLRAGAFEPNAALHFYMNGITPGMAARYYANGMTIAYAFSNNYLSYKDIERFFEVQ